MNDRSSGCNLCIFETSQILLEELFGFWRLFAFKTDILNSCIEIFETVDGNVDFVDVIHSENVDFRIIIVSVLFGG